MIRWGIIGAGRIAHRFVAALQNETDSQLYAISCRTQDKADAFACQYGNIKAYAGFDHIVNDPDVDAVYISVPHAYHKEWIIQCLKAGKPVLCEKPLCLSEEEVDEVIAVSRQTGVLCMEALKTRFVPLYDEIRKTVENGTIGKIVGVDTSLCSLADLSRTDLYYLNPTGGGALLDEGIYNAGWVEDYAPHDLKMTSIKAVYRDGVDLYTDAFLEENGFRVRLECAFDRKKEKKAVLHGTKGSITVYDLHRPVKAEVISHNEHRYIMEKPYVYDDFYGQIHHFVQLIRQGRKESDVVPLSVSKNCARILDTIRKGYSYDEKAVELLERQEEVLQYASFDYNGAWMLVKTILDLQKDYDRNISVSVFDEDQQLEIIRVLQDGKTEANLKYMNGKRSSAISCGHSSLYAYVAAVTSGHQPVFNETYCSSGGAFPIRINGKWKYTVTVSGLHEGGDHEIIIKALEIILKRKTDPFPYMMV